VICLARGDLSDRPRPERPHVRAGARRTQPLASGHPASTEVILSVGFCGAYITFSTFTFDTVRLVGEGAVSEAARNALGTVLTCAAAAAAGIALAAS
jgi:CrcB protein